MSLNKLLKNAGLNQSQLAALTGFHKQYVNDLCTGRRDIKKCGFESLNKIADALQMSIDELMKSIDNKELEYDVDGVLIIDEGAYDPHSDKFFIVRIGENWYYIMYATFARWLTPHKIPDDKLIPYRRAVSPEWMRMMAHEVFMYNIKFRDPSKNMKFQNEKE
ncbi:MAG: helix-turn-helix transcriptional regulator [Oscillospiraceae bacterium]